MYVPNQLKVNEKNHLKIGDCDVVELSKKYDTPLIVYDENVIRDKCRKYINSLKEHYPEKGEILYAAKAFMSLTTCKIIAEEGLGIDVVSGGELYTSLKAGIFPDKISFNGNNKTIQELEYAVKENIGSIIIDSFQEIDLIVDACKKNNKTMNVLLRISPGVDPETHEYIKTGKLDSKFGLPCKNEYIFEAVKKLIKSEHINFNGFHCHIGSQINTIKPFKHSAKIMMKVIKDVYDKFQYVTKELNLGGGLGVKYIPEDKPIEINEYIKSITDIVKRYSIEYNIKLPKLILEPGRSIIANSGTTIYKIGIIKDLPGIKKYVNVDGGMTDNIRPSLYNAKYYAVLANKINNTLSEEVTISGKCCESGDILINSIKLPKVERNDLLAVFSTGAYTYSMASNYNMNLRPLVILVNKANSEIIIKREGYKDLNKNDIIPKRLIP